uniref:hypothetical protein n=1 Tax=Thaumasiovibrio occultus TaxID=1891184 RepID=UPI000B35FFDC|nr:hypothetical protein [Thaumasiovibrio occultus]
MELLNVSPESAEFTLSGYLLFGSIACLFLFIARLASKDSVYSAGIKTLVLGLFFSALSYSAANKFYQLEVRNERIYLHYIWPVLNKDIAITNIDKITYGAKSKTRSCHISLNTYSGDRYSSVILSRDIAVCKAKMAELTDAITL